MHRSKHTVSPDYSLTKGLGLWELIFEGRHTIDRAALPEKPQRGFTYQLL